MSNASIHTYDYGTLFNLTIQDQTDTTVNLQGSSGNIITFLKPDKTTMIRSGVLPNGGSDGLMRYTTVENDITMAGIWSLQGHISHPSGNWYTNVVEFRVAGNI